MSANVFKSFNAIVKPRATALVFGGFGFKPHHIEKHASLYTRRGLDVQSWRFPVQHLTAPRGGERRGKMIAETLLAVNGPYVAHVVSGSFWMFLYAISQMSMTQRRQIKGVFFDSSPPTSRTDAFAGWASFAMNQPSLKPLLQPAFVPFRAFMGINEKWEQKVENWMIGEHSLIPFSTHMSFLIAQDDPVVNLEHYDSFVNFCCNTRTEKAVVERYTIKMGRHGLGIVDAPLTYESAVDRLIDRSLEDNVAPSSCSFVESQTSSQALELANYFQNLHLKYK